MNKRGQFFLIAALAIIVVIASLVAIYNSAEKGKEEVSTFNLAEEINFEGSQILKNGVYNSLPFSEIGERIENLTDYYAKTNRETDLLIVYSDEIQTVIIFYNNTGTEIEVSPSSFQPASIDNKFSSTQARTDDILVTISGQTYRETLRPGKIFMAFAMKNRNGERFVALPN